MRRPTATEGGPVFVVGQARSGTTILYRLILEHPSFRPAAGAPPNLAESHLVEAVLGCADLDTPRVRSFSQLDGQAWHALQADLRTSAGRRRLLRTVPAGAVRRSPALWQALGGAAAVDAVTRHAVAGRGVGRLVEKTPWHLPWVGQLLASVPGARAVSITRDPVRTFASYRRRAAQDPEGRWADIGVDDFVERWAREAAHTARWLDDPRFLLLRYEELVADPAGTSSALFAWLGEEPVVSLPGPIPVDPFAPPSDAPQLAGPITDRGDGWRAHVSDEEVARIEAALAPQVERLAAARRR